MNSPSKGSGDRVKSERAVSTAESSPLNLVRRILHRKDLPEASSTSFTISGAPARPSKPSMVERLEGFFTQDLPSDMQVLPTEELASGSHAGAKAIEKPSAHISTSQPTPVDQIANEGGPSEFMAVRSIRLAAKEAILRNQEAYREIDASLKNHAEELDRKRTELSAVAQTASAKLQEIQSSIAKDLTEELKKASQAILARHSQHLQERSDTFIAGLNEKLGAEKQRFVAETEKQFEDLRASRQAFVEDTQKQVAGAAQSSIESLARTTVEKARADLNSLKDAALGEAQKEIVSAKTSVESHTKDLAADAVTRARAELEASRDGFIQGTQDRLAELAQASQQRLREVAKTGTESAEAQLVASRQRLISETQAQAVTAAQSSFESMVQGAVEKGRQEMRLAIEELLAARKRQIESELNSLANRLGDSIRSHASYAQVGGFSRPTPVLGTAATQTRPLAFSLAETGQKRIDARDLWAGLTWGLKLGLGLGLAMLLLLGIYVSASPVVRLRPSPPASFLDQNPSWTAKQRAREEQLARSYWDIAVRDIETKYGFESELPEEPPDNFAVQEKGPSGGAPKVDSSERSRYWSKLREVWPQADTWERASDSGFGWIRDAWNTASLKVAQFFRASRSSAATAR